MPGRVRGPAPRRGAGAPRSRRALGRSAPPLPDAPLIRNLLAAGRMQPRLDASPIDPARRALEVVERKGLDHPDTLCDAGFAEVEVAAQRAAECLLVSRIGAPLDAPLAAGLRIDAPRRAVHNLREELRAIAAEEARRLPGLWRELVGPLAFDGPRRDERE